MEASSRSAQAYLEKEMIPIVTSRGITHRYANPHKYKKITITKTIARKAHIDESNVGTAAYAKQITVQNKSGARRKQVVVSKKGYTWNPEHAAYEKYEAKRKIEIYGAMPVRDKTLASQGLKEFRKETVTMEQRRFFYTYAKGKWYPKMSDRGTGEKKTAVYRVEAGKTPQHNTQYHYGGVYEAVLPDGRVIVLGQITGHSKRQRFQHYKTNEEMKTDAAISFNVHANKALRKAGLPTGTSIRMQKGGRTREWYSQRAYAEENENSDQAIEGGYQPPPEPPSEGETVDYRGGVQ